MEVAGFLELHGYYDGKTLWIRPKAIGSIRRLGTAPEATRGSLLTVGPIELQTREGPETLLDLMAPQLPVAWTEPAREVPEPEEEPAPRPEGWFRLWLRRLEEPIRLAVHGRPETDTTWED